MKLRIALVGLVALLSLGHTTVSGAAHPLFVLIDPPGSIDLAPEAIVTGLNESGTVIGNYVTEDGVSRAFVEQGGTFQELSPPSTTFTQALAVNNDNAVVGWFIDEGSSIHGYVFTGGTYALVDPPGATESFATGINNRGTIIGFFYDGSRYRGFVYADGSYTYPDAPCAFPLQINSSGAFAGDFFTYKRGACSPITTPGGVIIQGVTGFSDSGAVVGYDQGRGFLYKKGTYTAMTPSASTYSIATGINDADTVVGWFSTGIVDSGEHGFAYRNGKYQTIDVPGSVWTRVTSINNSGVVAGWFEDRYSVRHGFTMR